MFLCVACEWIIPIRCARCLTPRTIKDREKCFGYGEKCYVFGIARGFFLSRFSHRFLKIFSIGYNSASEDRHLFSFIFFHLYHRQTNPVFFNIFFFHFFILLHPMRRVKPNNFMTTTRRKAGNQNIVL